MRTWTSPARPFRSVARRRRALVLVPLGALALAVVPASPASAVKPVERDRGTFDDSFTDEICGVEVQIDVTGTYRVSIAPAPNTDGEPFLLRNSYTATEIWTVDGSEVVTVQVRGRVIEQHAEHVEGTIWRFTRQEAGTAVFRDASGTVLLRETGVQRAVEDFDTRGDQAPGADPVPDTYVELLRAGQAPGEDEFCARLLPALT
jgi:hypothetical protein